MGRDVGRDDLPAASLAVSAAQSSAGEEACKEDYDSGEMHIGGFGGCFWEVLGKVLLIW